MDVLWHVGGEVYFVVAHDAEVFFVPDAFLFFFPECLYEMIDHADVYDRHGKFDVSPVSWALVSIVSAEGAQPVPDAPEPGVSDPVGDGFPVVEAPGFGDFEHGCFFDIGPY